MLQPHVVLLLQESFSKLSPNSSRFTRVLYDRLFEIDPSLKRLFIRDIREQRRKFFRKMDYLIKNLNNLSTIEPSIIEMGQRHSYYNVKREDYKTFFSALIYTLSAALGNDFTFEVRQAWYELCEYIGGLMCEEIKKERKPILEKAKRELELRSMQKISQ